MAMMEDNAIVVTGSRIQRKAMGSAAPAMIANEEQLGDLKLYRIPERLNVAAKGLKQVAYLNKEKVRGEFLYVAQCEPYDRFEPTDDVGEMDQTQLLLTMKNEKKKGLGAALPMGGLTLFEPGPAGTQLVAELDMRDYAIGQDVELELGVSAQVFSQCAAVVDTNLQKRGRKWTKMRSMVSNANNHPVKVRVLLGWPQDYEVRWPRKSPRLKDGYLIVELIVPANSTREYKWKIRHSDAYLADNE